MTREAYQQLYQYMVAYMEDSAHDKEHVMRVLYGALEIARTEDAVDTDILIAACLLHDVGRAAQAKNPALCHAEVGAAMAHAYLLEHGYEAAFADRVRDCIFTHRFRKERQPESIEAKILFDADKLDVTGAIGIARTLEYRGAMAEPLYTLLPDGSVSDGDGDQASSFFQEYHRKLRHIYDRFYTKKGAELAEQRRKAAEEFYESLLREVRDTYEMRSAVEDVLE